MGNDTWKKTEQQMRAILSGVMSDRGWEAQLELHSIFPRWAKLVEEDMASHAWPLKIVKGVLWIEVENSAWLQQFQFQKVSLLRQLNSSLARQQLKDLRFVLLQRSDTKKEGEDRKVRFASPPEEEIRRFEAQASYIEDDATREALVRFWYLSHACVRDEDDTSSTKK